jgi:anti-sigma factor RsiW
MLTCRWVQDRVLVYLAGELDPVDSGRVWQHLERCTRCAGALEALAEAQDLVEGSLPTSVRAPERLQDQVMNTVRRQQAARASAGAGLRRRLSLAGAALGLLGAGYVGGMQHQVLRTPEAGHHTLATAAAPVLPLAVFQADHRDHAGRVSASPEALDDPRAVADQLSGRLETPVVPIDLEGVGARLVAGREIRLHDTPSTALNYIWGGESVSVYQVDSAAFSLPFLQEVPADGGCFLVGGEDRQSFVVWCSGPSHFVAVASVAPEQLLTLARAASRQTGIV